MRLLSNYGCDLDKVDDNAMSALMLAAERGHAGVVRILIQAGAKLDTLTKQNMSALMLSCLGGIDCIATVKTLLARGCIIDFKDDQGRTAHDIALETNVNLAEIIDHEVQLLLMKQTVHIERKYTFAMLWILLHDGRASIPALFVGLTRPYTKKHCSDLASSFLAMNAKHTSHLALVQTMMLPFDLVTTIASFLPLPQLWEKRVEMLSRSYHLSPDITISSAIDLIDDVLDEVGFTDACDSIGITAPASFGTWVSWMEWFISNPP